MIIASYKQFITNNQIRRCPILKKLFRNPSNGTDIKH